MDAEVDVLVAGAGAAGMTAALVCALQGLERSALREVPQVGGTTATSAGTIWVPGTRQAREAGFKDDIPEARRYLNSIIGPATDGRREAYLTPAPKLVEYLGRNSEVKFSLYAKHPDYLSNRPGTTLAGRALAPLPFDGRLLGADFALLRPPIGEFMALGGMMIGRDDIEPLRVRSGRSRTSAALPRCCGDKPPTGCGHRRGTRLLMGNALAARLFYSLRQRKRAGLAQRIVARTDERRWPRHRRRASVDGETRHVDSAARRRACDRRIRRQRRADSTNMSVRRSSMRSHSRRRRRRAWRLARAAGAAVEDDHAQPAFWTPVSETRWLEGGRGAYPHLALDRSKPGLIAVNNAGRRFVDEAVSYHEFVIGMHRSHETVPTIPAWLICDRAFIDDTASAAFRPGGEA